MTTEEPFSNTYDILTSIFPFCLPCI